METGKGVHQKTGNNTEELQEFTIKMDCILRDKYHYKKFFVFFFHKKKTEKIVPKLKHGGLGSIIL